MSTENIAYEKRYQGWRAQYDYLFAPENRFPQQEEQFPLADGYSVCSNAYFHNGDHHLNGSENELLDKKGKVRYAWRDLDADAEFCSMFCHCNENHDLIFRTELYGYSVLEVESGQEKCPPSWSGSVPSGKFPSRFKNMPCRFCTVF